MIHIERGTYDGPADGTGDGLALGNGDVDGGACGVSVGDAVVVGPTVGVIVGKGDSSDPSALAAAACAPPSVPTDARKTADEAAMATAMRIGNNCSTDSVSLFIPRFALSFCYPLWRPLKLSARKRITQSRAAIYRTPLA
jgi:hypothetical protein